MVKVYPATLETTNKDTEKKDISSSTDLISATILTIVKSRSCSVQLEDGLREAVGSQACVQTGTVPAAGHVRQRNNTKSFLTVGTNCCEEDDLDELTCC